MNMRLSEGVTRKILEAARPSFGDAPVYLFGSRIDDAARGGDIDLAVETDVDKETFRKEKIDFLVRLEKAGVEYPVDVVQLNEDTEALLKAEIEAVKIRLSH